MPAFGERFVDRFGDAVDIRPDPGFEFGAPYRSSNIDARVLKAEFGAILRGQLLLGARDGAVEQEAQIVLHDRDEPVQRLRVRGEPGKLAQLPQFA